MVSRRSNRVRTISAITARRAISLHNPKMRSRRTSEITPLVQRTVRRRIVSSRDQRKGQQTQDRANPQRDNQTTGQGAAGRSGGAALTTEQRTKISTTIRQSNVRPMTNVRFNIAIGTAVPRDVTLHPLPAAVIEVYPEWRPYRFVLVGNEILVIDPATHEIVAILEA